MYHQTTNCIKVTVSPVYLEDQSSPIEAHYVWAYQVTIENHGQTAVQLRNRAWSITDATGHTQEVRGPGVGSVRPAPPPTIGDGAFCALCMGHLN